MVKNPICIDCGKLINWDKAVAVKFNHKTAYICYQCADHALRIKNPIRHTKEGNVAKYVRVKAHISTKAEAVKIANSMRRKGYERVRITKEGSHYNIWAFC